MRNARLYAAASKETVLDSLRTNGAALAGFVRGLTDEQLEQTIALGSRAWTTRQFIEQVVMGHPAMHGRSIRTVLGA